MRPAAAQPQTIASASTVDAVRIDGLNVRYDERLVLQDITLSIPQGQYIALLGANGAGKSTLLKVLAMLLSPSAGELRLFGLDVARHGVELRSRIGLVGHQSMLYRDLTIRENLEFFGRLYGVHAAASRADLLLEAVGLANRADDPVKALSRGMTQRAAIARALMHSPDLLLADEPFAGLDVPSAAALEELLGILHRKGKTVVLVNHDIGQSLRMAQRVVVLRRGRLVLDSVAQIDQAAVVAEVSAP